MPHPSAPMLQAEYHNYNEHSSFNDYYGGFEPKQSTWNPSSGPRRVDNSISKNNRGCCTPCGIHILSSLVVVRAAIVLLCAYFLWTHGYQTEPVFWIAVFEVINILACLMMTCGIECSNPYLCVIFTVIRTLESFCALVMVIAFGMAVYDPQSDAGRFIKAQVNEFGRHYKQEVPFKANWDDIAYQLSIFLCLLSLFIFSSCVFFMRCSWTATLWAADERRRRVYTENRQVVNMVASDELYTNY